MIIVSTGGGRTFGEDVRDAILGDLRRSGAPEAEWPSVDAIFEEARADPESARTWGGGSYRYWAEAIDRRPVDALLGSGGDVLMIHGTADTSVPVASARAAAEAFTCAGRCNLIYWEFGGYDHGMTDAAGRDKLQEVLALSAAWLRQRLGEKPADAACPA